MTRQLLPNVHSSDDYTLGYYIAKGSYGAVFNTKLKSNNEEDNFCVMKDFNDDCKLVIKQMFNHGLRK